MSMKKETPADQKLHRAAMYGDVLALRKVLDSGKVHVDCQDKEGTTPLILACANNHLECVLELLNQGANIQARRVTGTTALFFASQGGFIDIVRLLLKRGTCTDASAASVDGGTPLIVACQCGNAEVAEELIAAGGNIHTEMRDRATALFLAAQNGHDKMVAFLLERGAKVDAPRVDGATPLWIASQMGHHSVVHQLLSAGAYVNATRHDGASALFKAAHKGHVDVVRQLLKYKPNLGLLPNGETALHAASLFGHFYIVQMLIEAGANPRIPNQDGFNALDLAQQEHHFKLTRYLQAVFKGRNGADT